MRYRYPQKNGAILIDHRTARQGVTLIELTIVLTAIAMIDGGILVRESLIRAAEL